MKMISDSAVLFYFSPKKIKYLHYKNIDAIFFFVVGIFFPKLKFDLR